MRQSKGSLVWAQLHERTTLLVNHLLMAEPAAVQRLLPHTGKRLRVEVVDWTVFLPVPPLSTFRVTPAGLLEWVGDSEGEGGPNGVAELQMRISAPNPALLMVKLAVGQRPDVEVQGDAQFAADVHWLADNLRWDLEGDLSRWVGPVAAHQIASRGAALAAGLRRWVAQ